MKAIGYLGAQLWACKQNAYSIVICAPDKESATQAFDLFLDDRPMSDSARAVVMQSRRTIKAVKSLGARPLYWAGVDPTK